MNKPTPEQLINQFTEDLLDKAGVIYGPGVTVTISGPYTATTFLVEHGDTPIGQFIFDLHASEPADIAEASSAIRSPHPSQYKAISR
jgi:hypothetical protein